MQTIKTGLLFAGIALATSTAVAQDKKMDAPKDAAPAMMIMHQCKDQMAMPRTDAMKK